MRCGADWDLDHSSIIYGLYHTPAHDHHHHQTRNIISDKQNNCSPIVGVVDTHPCLVVSQVISPLRVTSCAMKHGTTET